MAAPITIYLTRHGEVFNPDNIFYGRMAGYYLSERGCQQADAAGRYLSNQLLDAVYSSPMERAQQTAGFIISAQQYPLTLQVDERLNEVHSHLDGVSHTELEKIHHDLYTDAPEGYEQPRDIRRRVLAFIADLRSRHPGGKIAVVSHGDIVVSMFMFAMRQHEDNIGRTRYEENRMSLFNLGLPEPYPATASINTLTYSTNDPDEIPAYHYYRPYE